MSKLTKFFLSPRLFFEDAKKNRHRRSTTTQIPGKVQSHSVKPPVKPPAKPSVKPIVKTDGHRKDDIHLAGKLLEIESVYPVNNIKLINQSEIKNLNLHFWPFLRHFFWVRCQAHYKGKNPEKISTSKMYISLEWRDHYEDIADIKTVNQVEAQSTDFLFFTNLRGTEQTLVNNKIYNRITDPIFEIAKEIGVAKKVEVVKSIGKLKKSEDRFHPVDLIYPPLLRKVGYRQLVNMPAQFLQQVKAILPEIKISEDAILSEIEFFLHQRDFYIELLQKYNPKVVFFVGFDYYYGLILAAKELGIKTVDLQHGVQAGWSPVYNHWQTLPKGGYKLLPDYFWVWGAYDQQKIEHNFPIDSVRPIIGGYPWMSRQQDFFCSENLLEGNETTLFGVISLQDQKKFPEIFSEIVLSTLGKIQWVVRRHPKHQNIKFDHLKDVVLSGKKYDECNFSIILRKAKIHVTECSTSVIDADYFGVPSIVTGEQGFLNYRDFIENGSVVHIDSTSDVQKIIDDLLLLKIESRMNVIDNSNTAILALENLMKGYYER